MREALAGVHFVEHGLSPYMVDPRGVSTSHGLSVVVASLLGLVSERDRSAWWAMAAVPGGACAHSALNGVLLDRAWEAAEAMESGRLPFLLATPTWHTGALDAAELVERLRVYRESGAVPGPADFAQALLRVRRCGAPRGRVRRGGRGAGHRGGRPAGRVAPGGRAGGPGAAASGDRRLPSLGGQLVAAVGHRGASGAPRDAGAGGDPARLPAGVPLAGPGAAPPGPAVLPLGAGALLALDGDVAEDPETLAAWLLPDLLFAADEGSGGPSASCRRWPRARA